MFLVLNLFYLGILILGGVLLYPLSISLSEKYNESFYEIIKNIKRKSFGWKSLLFGILFAGLCIALQIMYFKNLFIFNWTSVFIQCFLFLILLAGLVDAKKQIIPDLISYPLILLGFIGAIIDPYFIAMPYDSVIGAGVGYLLPSILGFGFEMFGKKGGIGSGDIKFLAGIGAWLGLYGLIYSVIGACVLSVFWVIIKKKRQFPFAPFCAGGSLIYLLMLVG